MKDDDGRGAERKRGRNGYFELYRFYADLYQADERTIKRWVGIGRKCEPADELDLDNPEQVYEWWSRNMKAKCPDGILSALVKFRKASPVKKEAAEVVDVEVEVPAVPELPVTDAEKGMDEMLDRLQDVEVKLSRRATEPGQAKAWLDTVARIGSVSSAVRAEKEELGKLIPKDLAEMLIREFHGPIEQGVRGMYPAFCQATGQVQSPANQARWDALCDSLFSRFTEEVFSEV
mgnify:CR=1 FL=1